MNVMTSMLYRYDENAARSDEAHPAGHRHGVHQGRPSRLPERHGHSGGGLSVLEQHRAASAVRPDHHQAHPERRSVHALCLAGILHCQACGLSTV